MFKKMKEKEEMSGKKKLSENELKAKTSVLQNLRKVASDAMGAKLSGLKKVTVTSDSEEGLEKGLEKAKEMLPSESADCSLHGDACDDESCEGKASKEMESSEESDEISEMSEEDLDAKLAELMALKEKMKSSK